MQLFRGLDDTQSLTPLSRSTSPGLECSSGTLGPHLNGPLACLGLSHLTGGQITLGPLWPCVTLFPMQGAEIWNLLPITFDLWCFPGKDPLSSRTLHLPHP